MFKIKNLVHDIKDVPSAWIFENYCRLKERLNGQDVKIKSLFNKERTPSMCIYLADKEKKVYKYKDFSSGKGGSAVDLVKEIKQVSYHKACAEILESYNDFVLHNNGGYDIQDFKEASKYKLDSVTYRTWTTKDQYFWTQFNIGSSLLNLYNIRPIDSYNLIKEDKHLIISGNYLYAYCNNKGNVYKIYQPKTLDKKFIKIDNYIQGSEQLEGNDYLIITSSLKDVMAIRSLKLKMDIIAPDSENTLIKSVYMDEYVKKYKKIILLFDNDDPGIKAMMKYKEVYPYVEMCVLPMSKDVSDSIKDHGPKEVLNRLVPIINKKL